MYVFFIQKFNKEKNCVYSGCILYKFELNSGRILFRRRIDEICENQRQVKLNSRRMREIRRTLATSYKIYTRVLDPGLTEVLLKEFLNKKKL